MSMSAALFEELKPYSHTSESHLLQYSLHVLDNGGGSRQLELTGSAEALFHQSVYLSTERIMSLALSKYSGGGEHGVDKCFTSGPIPLQGMSICC